MVARSKVTVSGESRMKRRAGGRGLLLTLLGALSLLGSLALAGVVLAADFSVQPVVETSPATGSGDNADDPAIWIHPGNPANSTVIGSDKNGSSGGVHVFALDGSQIQFVNAGEINNVDVRYSFPLGGTVVDLVVGSNRSSNWLEIFTINQADGTLTNVTGSTSLGYEPYGLALYHSWQTGKYYAFVSQASSPHNVLQYELTAGSGGTVDATLARTISGLGSGQSEGIAADDVHGNLFAAVEDEKIYRFSAEPGGETTGSQGTVIANVGDNGLTADIEGLTIYYAGQNNGYLMASSQGSSEFFIYGRQAPNSFITKLNVVANGGIDACSSTDGIDVTPSNLGGAFSQGLFVAHDNSNSDGSASNYKLVPWSSVVTGAAGAGATLLTDTSYNPRSAPTGVALAGFTARPGADWRPLAAAAGVVATLYALGVVRRRRF